MANTLKMKAASYNRYSSDAQKETSIEDQIRMNKDAIERQGWQFTLAYSDYAISGATKARSGLQAMMKDAAEGRFDILVVEGTERLSRDQEDLAGIYKRLTYYGVQIYSVTSGSFVNDMHVAFDGLKNSQFLKDLAYKTKRGQFGAIERGKILSNKTYGYDIVRRLDSDGELVKGERKINNEQAAIVRRIFESYAKGLSGREISFELNKENIPSPTGKEWLSSTIAGWQSRGKGILNNELYIGRVIWNRDKYRRNPDTQKRNKQENPKEEWVITEAPHLRIIDQDLWDKVKTRQALLAKNNLPHQKRRANYLLSYLLKCGACGGGYGLVSARHYGCTKSRQSGTCTVRKTIPKDKLEQAVLSALEYQLLNRDLVNEFVTEYNAYVKTSQSSQHAQIKSVHAQLKKLETEKSNLIKAIRDGIPASELTEEFNRNAQKREQLLSLAAQFEQPAKIITTDVASKYTDAITLFSADIQSKTPDRESIDLLRHLIDKIVITPDTEHNKLTAQLHGDLAGLFSDNAEAQALLEQSDTTKTNQQRMNNAGAIAEEPEPKSLLLRITMFFL
ncbi:recombinase family protein [Alteromonadaceae bacterium M269]|nr:recombinase family protein [Alteromonadaceae bacterium M269]